MHDELGNMRNLVLKQGGRESLEDLVVDWKIILKCIMAHRYWGIFWLGFRLLNYFSRRFCSRERYQLPVELSVHTNHPVIHSTLTSIVLYKVHHF
jgi:hypothetical protein